MNTSWIIHTCGNPLAATRQFLHDLWDQVGLEGMHVPVYEDGNGVTLRLVNDPDQLSVANPFVPVMTMSAVRRVVELSRQRPGARLAAVLRPCEARAVNFLAGSGKVTLENWLLIGVDCLAAFPDEDFAWRVQKPGGIRRLTEQALHFARQGGIAPYRFRSACQACTSPCPEGVDLALGLLGLPVHRFMMVTAKDTETIEQLNLHELIGTWVWPAVVAQRSDTLAALDERRRHARERFVNKLPLDAPDDSEELVDLLTGCAPCQLCLAACPICGELGLLSNGRLANQAIVEQWLTGCVQCGLCEDACPLQRPLTTIIGRISRELSPEPALA